MLSKALSSISGANSWKVAVAQRKQVIDRNRSNQRGKIPIGRHPARTRVSPKVTLRRVQTGRVDPMPGFAGRVLPNRYLITHYPQRSSHGTKQEQMAVSAGLNDGGQYGAVSKGAQRGPVCCSLRNRGSVPGGGDALALAIRLCLPGVCRQASQLHQDPRALPVFRLSTADFADRRNDFRGDQGAAVYLVSRHVPPHSD